jgi:hypothetical protein
MDRIGKMKSMYGVRRREDSRCIIGLMVESLTLL